MISKGDQFTVDEIKQVKINLIQDAKHQNVKFFDIESTVSDIQNSREKEIILEECLKGVPPFTIVNPQCIIEENHRTRAGRQYPYGFCDAFSAVTSDFTHLHKIVIKYTRLDIINVCDDKYKKFIKKQKENQEKK